MGTKEIAFDYSGTILPDHGLTPNSLADFADQLDAARSATLADIDLMESGATIPPESDPLDAGFIRLPERLLADESDSGELARIMRAAERFREAVDAFVVVGIGGSYMGTRALFETCCRPYHNYFDREQRGGVPRIFFEGNGIDNDCLLDLQELLGEYHKSGSRWGIVAVSKSGGTLEPAIALRQLMSQMVADCADNPEQLAELFVPITGPTGAIRKLAEELKCPDVFPVPDGVGGRFSIFSAVGLFPAAVLGLDIRELLRGAAAMNERFATAPVLQNPVLCHAGVSHLLEKQKGLTSRVMSVWSKQLESTGLWYDQLLSESLGKSEKGATPITAVNTRDLHSRGQQHQDGRRDKLICNVSVDASTRPGAHVAKLDNVFDGYDDLCSITLPEVLEAATIGTNTAYRKDQRPTMSLRLPRFDEYSMGQLFQLLMLSTVVEGKLIGINPYGQPAVEGYKNETKAALRNR